MQLDSDAQRFLEDFLPEYPACSFLEKKWVLKDSVYHSCIKIVDDEGAGGLKISCFLSEDIVLEDSLVSSLLIACSKDFRPCSTCLRSDSSVLRSYVLYKKAFEELYNFKTQFVGLSFSKENFSKEILHSIVVLFSKYISLDNSIKRLKTGSIFSSSFVKKELIAAFAALRQSIFASGLTEKDILLHSKLYAFDAWAADFSSRLPRDSSLGVNSFCSWASLKKQLISGVLKTEKDFNDSLVSALQHDVAKHVRNVLSAKTDVSPFFEKELTLSLLKTAEVLIDSFEKSFFSFDQDFSTRSMFIAYKTISPDSDISHFSLCALLSSDCFISPDGKHIVFVVPKVDFKHAAVASSHASGCVLVADKLETDTKDTVLMALSFLPGMSYYNALPAARRLAV